MLDFVILPGSVLQVDGGVEFAFGKKRRIDVNQTKPTLISIFQKTLHIGQIISQNQGISALFIGDGIVLRHPVKDGIRLRSRQHLSLFQPIL